MSSHAIGLRSPAGKQHRKNAEAAQALHDAGIFELPPQLKEYFDCSLTDEVIYDEMSGCKVDIQGALTVSKEREMHEDFTVELAKLPEGVTHIRFTNSY